MRVASHILRSHSCSSWLLELRALFSLAAPIALTFLFQIALGMQSIFFVGHLGGEQLAAGALGFMWCNVTGFSLMVGLLSALDSLGSQAFGSKRYHFVGILVQRGFFMCSFIIPFIIILWWVAEPLLLALKMDPVVSRFTGTFVRWMIPALPFYAAVESCKRYLQVQGIVLPILAISLLSTLFSVASSYFFVVMLNLDFVGAPIALVITYVFFLISLVAYVYSRDLHTLTWPGWSPREALSDIKEFLKLGLAGVIMTCAEWWAFEIQAVFAGWLGTLPLDAHTVLINMSSFLFMIPLGLSVAVSTRVGNELGADRPSRAFRSARVAFLIGLPIQLIQALILFGIRSFAGSLFSGDVVVVKMVGGLLPLLCVATIGDSIQGVASGILRGMARQNLGAFVNIGVYYGVGLPISYIMAFRLELNVGGLWIGLTAAAWVQAFIFLVAIARSSWREEARCAVERAAKEAESSSLVSEPDFLLPKKGDLSEPTQSMGI